MENAGHTRCKKSLGFAESTKVITLYTSWGKWKPCNVFDEGSGVWKSFLFHEITWFFSLSLPPFLCLSLPPSLSSFFLSFLPVCFFLSFIFQEPFIKQLYISCIMLGLLWMKWLESRMCARAEGRAVLKGRLTFCCWGHWMSD